MDPVKSLHGAANGLLAAEQPTLGEDDELLDADMFLEEVCEATIVRLDASALEALFQKARS